MAEQPHPNHPDYRDAPEPQQRRPASNGQVMGPIDALSEQTLAVDLARAEIDQQIATAHRFPRNIDVVERKIAQLVLRDEATAARCVYALPRAGKPIVGPSIGFMRIVANCWGNCRIFAEPTYIDRAAKMVYARGAFLDLETNVTAAVSVSRRISDKSGRLYNDDMIAVTQQAAVSIAFRNAVRAGTSEGLWYPIYERALYIVRGTEETLPERREKAIKLLANFGVDPAKVFMFLQIKGINEIKVDHLPTLRGMFTALQDGSVSADEMFDPRRMQGVHFETVDNPLADEDAPGAAQGGAAPAATQAIAQPAPAAAAQEARQAGDEPGGSEPAPAAKDAPAATPGPAAGQEPAAEAKPKGGKGKKAEPAAKAEPAKDDEVKPAPAGPTTPEAYEAYCTARVAAFGGETALTEWWRSKAERDLRNKCMLVEDAFLRCKAIFDNRLAELRGAK